MCVIGFDRAMYDISVCLRVCERVCVCVCVMLEVALKLQLMALAVGALESGVQYFYHL